MRVIPNKQVIPFMAAEPLVLEEEDECEGDGPVAEQGDEIRHDGREVVFPCDGDDGDDQRGEKRPDEARDGVEPVA